MFDILTLGNELLRVKCKQIDLFDHRLELLERKMYETLEEADGVGLAAPQVGISDRIFVVLIPKENIKQTFVNPVITEFSKETSSYCEGCLSVPGMNHDIIRPSSVTIYAQDIHGKPFNIKAEGLFARVIQHEYDHLDGKLYIDYIDESEKKAFIDKYNRLKKGRRRKG